MNLKIISWNVRGLNDAGKKLTISNLLRNWKPDLVCLQETKMEWIFASIVLGLWGGSFTGWTVLPPSRASNGILLMWDKRAVECTEEAVGTFSISCKFERVMDQFVWAFLEHLQQTL
jgi:exonuclease III